MKQEMEADTKDGNRTGLPGMQSIRRIQLYHSCLKHTEGRHRFAPLPSQEKYGFVMGMTMRPDHCSRHDRVAVDAKQMNDPGAIREARYFRYNLTA